MLGEQNVIQFGFKYSYELSRMNFEHMRSFDRIFLIIPVCYLSVDKLEERNNLWFISWEIQEFCFYLSLLSKNM